MPLIKTPNGWQVLAIDGKEKLSPDNLTHEAAVKREEEEKKRHPLKTWSRIRGILKP